MPRVPVCDGHSIPEVVYVTFGGVFAHLGTVALAFGGGAPGLGFVWLGSAAGAGGCGGRAWDLGFEVCTTRAAGGVYVAFRQPSSAGPPIGGCFANPGTTAGYAYPVASWLPFLVTVSSTSGNNPLGCPECSNQAFTFVISETPP